MSATFVFEPKVVALGVPCPPFPGNPLDPPLRSRFQARHISRVPAVSWRTWGMFCRGSGWGSGWQGFILMCVSVVVCGCSIFIASCCCMCDSSGPLWVCNAVTICDIRCVWRMRCSTQSIQWFCKFDSCTHQAEIPPTTIMLISRILARWFFRLDRRIPRTWKGWPLIALSEVEQESLGWTDLIEELLWVWLINAHNSLILDRFLPDRFICWREPYIDRDMLVVDGR